MSIVLQHDSRANVTYAYHNETRWDKERKQSSSNRILIGKIDPESGKVIRTSGARRKKQIDEALIAKEIEEYNKKIDEKHKLEIELMNGNTQDLREVKEKYMELQRQIEDISKVMLSFADSLRSVLGK